MAIESHLRSLNLAQGKDIVLRTATVIGLSGLVLAGVYGYARANEGDLNFNQLLIAGDITPNRMPVPDPINEQTRLIDNAYQKVIAIHAVKASWDGKDPTFPSPALKKTFDEIQAAHTRLQIMSKDGKYSPDEIREISSMYQKLTLAPSADKPVASTQINVDPDTKDGQFITQQTKALFNVMPGHEKIFSDVNIISRDGGKWRFSGVGDATSEISKDGRTILIIPDRPAPDYAGDTKSWPENKKRLLQVIMQVTAGAVDLYGGTDHSYGLLSPSERINLIFRDTVITDMEERLGYGNPWRAGVNPYVIIDLFGDTSSLNSILKREEAVKEARKKLAKAWLSSALGKEFDVVEAGKQLGIR